MSTPPTTSLVLQLLLLERYGARMTMDQLASELGMSRGSVYNQVSAGTLPVPTYLDAGKRWADSRDVAAHFDACRARARQTA